NLITRVGWDFRLADYVRTVTSKPNAAIDGQLRDDAASCIPGGGALGAACRTERFRLLRRPAGRAKQSERCHCRRRDHSRIEASDWRITVDSIFLDFAFGRTG